MNRLGQCRRAHSALLALRTARPWELELIRAPLAPLASNQPLQWRYYSSKPQENQSFVMNAFRGKLVTAELFPFPDVLDEEQRQNLSMFIDPVQKFFEEVNDPARNDKEETVPPEIVAHLREMGSFGLQTPTEYGGLGLTNTQATRLGQIVGANDLGIGIFLGAHQSIGFKGIVLYGNEEQKAKYLPKCASGETFAAFSLTEPSAGSDAMSIKSRAVKSSDGSHYVLNGSKIWISNGGIADVFTVFAQTPMKDPKTGEMKDKMSAFIVERGYKGVASGPPEKKMGIKASNTAEVYFEDVIVPAENLLGEEGEGFKVAMNILNNGRFGMAAALSGTMKVLVGRAVEHATTRVQFGSKLETYGVVQEKIARLSIMQYVTESLAFLLSGIMDQGAQEYQLEAAISKIYSSEAAWEAVDEVIQLYGGMGFMSECGLERVMRDLRIFRIFEGSNDILRLFVSLTGLQYAGNHLRQLERDMKGFKMGVMASEGFKRGKRFVGARTVEPLTGQVHPDLAKPADQLCDVVGQFGTACEGMLIKYKKNIIHEQFLLTRLADASIDIYCMAAVLTRCTKSLSEGLPTASHERTMTTVFCQQAHARVCRNLASLTSSRDLLADDFTSSVAKEVIGHGGIITVPPVGF